MRKWGTSFFGNTKPKESSGETPAPVEAQPADGSSRSFQAERPTINHASSFRNFRNSQMNQEAKRERLVSTAARNLGDGVQNIVMAAKAKEGNQGEWKVEIVKLLGAGTEKTDIDTLLENTSCDTFVLRCVENDLPPNLIHCLRLLRVLELQHASEADEGVELEPVSSKATSKVSRLLCKLCTHPSVGEQLRPHLFGLFALSGASYPKSGVHVARAASDVIIAFAEFCLSRQLVWFIHDRKMIVHMTDDIKDLSGMTSTGTGPAPPPVPMGLVGTAAEEAGLWAIALRTVVKLIYFSCRHDSVELLKAFEVAGGYDVLEYTIKKATRPYGKELIELLPLLACCPGELMEGVADDGPNKLAVNMQVFDLQENLISRSNPLLREHLRLHDDISPDLSELETVKELAALSIQTAVGLRASEKVDSPEKFHFNVASELLSATLQLFSDHSKNYEIVEERLHILSYDLLSFPCYDDDDFKGFVLKTLEFVVTGVGVSNEVTPVNACVETFFALSQALLKGEDAMSSATNDKSHTLALLAIDAELMGGTLEKLLQFDQRVAPLMVESGIMTKNLDSLLSFLPEDSGSLPPTKETRVDKTLQIVCRVLKLLVAHQPVNFSKDSDEPDDVADFSNLHTLLRRSTSELGIEAARAAAGVFEAFMASFASIIGLNRDMRFVLQIVEDLSQELKSDISDDERASIVQRQGVLFSMLRNVLEARSLARSSFRSCGGLDTILKVLVSLKQSVEDPVAEFHADFPAVLVQMIQSAVGLLDATTGLKARNPMTSNEASPLFMSADVVVDAVSSQLSGPVPASINRNHIRSTGFYIDMATGIAGTGILGSKHVDAVLDAALSHIDQSLKITMEKSTDPLSLRNPDAIRLVLGIAVFLPESEEGKALSNRILDGMLRLCERDRVCTTLSQLASCGMCHSLTSPREFGPILFGSKHHLKSQFSTLLSRISSYSLSYMDFVTLLRCIAGPVLSSDAADGRPRLPTISSSTQTSNLTPMSIGSSGSRRKDDELCDRLQAIYEIARNGDRYKRLRLGGSSINTIAVLMHQVKIEDRLRVAAEEGRLSFIEFDSIDSSAVGSDGQAVSTQSAPTSSGSEKVWSPLITSGFTYSMWMRHDFQGSSAGNFYILDISSSPTQGATFLSFWYDVEKQRFNVLSSTAYKGEPISFPVSPLLPNIWHHIMLTYSPAKRSMMSRKSAIAIYVDGRPVEADVRVDAVNLPPNSRVLVGAPNASLAAGGVVGGLIPVWELGPTLMLSAVLLDLDAAAIYSYGPDFPGLLWGDRPQRLSLAATASTVFSMLADTGELGSVASALRRRDIPKLEQAGYCSLGPTQKDDLSTMNLLCTIPPECVIFGVQPATTLSKVRNESGREGAKERLVNLARMNLANDVVSTDAMLYGKANIVTAVPFSNCLTWAGGPTLLLPLVNGARSSHAAALAVAILRESCKMNLPNLEAMQAGGGYRMLAVLLQERVDLDANVLDQCVAFAVHRYDVNTGGEASTERASDDLVFCDLDAMKYVLLNHQVWSLRKYGPALPLRLLSILNRMVDHRATHKAFNARRLHQAGIVRWALHLMIEAAELYTAGENAVRGRRRRSGEAPGDGPGPTTSWYVESPFVVDVSVGADPGNPFLLECKNLLRRVLTFMLTPGDLEGLAESVVFSVSISGKGFKSSVGARERQTSSGRNEDVSENEKRMNPGPTMRLHLVRLLEELIVDGVNEIVASAPPPVSPGSPDAAREHIMQPHAGGVASPDQPYFSTASRRAKGKDSTVHPKHQQAQAFLSAFAGFLTPVWFATVLEGCREEASASATLRLMILMIQGSSAFEAAFQAAGAFAPFVLSVPNFSTSPGIAITMLSQLLSAPILHLHSLPTLDPVQLCEVFDVEGDDSQVILNHVPSDPASGIFALLAECLGRNAQMITTDHELATKAKDTNQAIFQLLLHRHDVSPAFQEYCYTAAFLEPLSQALCLVYDEKLQKAAPMLSKRRSALAEIPKDITPTERFVGEMNDPDSSGMGIVRLLRRVIKSAITSGPRAAAPLWEIFRSFPIHASPQQVEVFHLILIEHIRSVVEEVVQHGDALALANCVGVSSVLLTRLVGGFLTSEGALEVVKVIVYVLNALTGTETEAVNQLSSQEHALLTMDAAHIASLSCVTALKMSLGSGGSDRGDEDLQSEILQIVDSNVVSLLLIQSRDIKSKRKIPTGPFPKTPNSKLAPIWQSTSVVRSLQLPSLAYPDLAETENPEIVIIAPLLVSLHRLLMSSREDVRSLSVSVLVSLLRHRPGVMSDLLVTEIDNGGQVETIDVVNRGGFRALLAAHEAATMSESRSTSVSVKRKYASFFSWFERNQPHVKVVFQAVNAKAMSLFPGLERANVLPADAVESEQKQMLMRLTTEAADRSILSGLERSELAKKSSERMTDRHSAWRRQGFDDLAYGGTKWKTLLRQLKGSRTIWEGGPGPNDRISLSLEDRLSALTSGGVVVESRSQELTKSWKLDLSEGFEGQRRRLLPNYEFRALYNLDVEDDSANELSEDVEDAGADDVGASDWGQMEVTTALLKDLNLKRAQHSEDEFGYFDADGEDGEEGTVGTTASTASVGTEEQPTEESSPALAQSPDDQGGQRKEEGDRSSNYELIIGLLKAGDWPETCYNVRRCTGLEVTKALLIWCLNAIYIIDGFELVGDDSMGGRITRVEREKSSFHINLRPDAAQGGNDVTSPKPKKGIPRTKSSGADLPAQEGSEGIYEHRSKRIPFSDLYSVYRRRYQLQQIALEFYDTDKSATLVAFESANVREDVLSKVLNSRLPNSIFNSSYGTYTSYTKFINNLKSRVVSQWVHGKMSNFEFLMHLNALAGRSFNDLTQYPVFPWVIADYDSEEIDLGDPGVYRDLSKPMGAIGEDRAQHFRERYEGLESSYFGEDDTPPFHYGTHYSCAAYVLYYLMRLEPFSRLAISLQGGKFDVADRLFHDIGRSWKSASEENLQDVRELIPEFFYNPDFLVNSNSFDFGETQKGVTVHDVLLPKWAKGDPARFVRINRQALESDYVSRNLHKWIDLVFGYKQRGQDAVDALNVFVHVTYEGEVDIDAMTDPVERASTIAQIQHFGQTPTRLERRAFPERVVAQALRGTSIDFGALSTLAPLAPPFCVTGAPQRVHVKATLIDSCKVGLTMQWDKAVGDLCYIRGQLIGVGRQCSLILPSKTYYRFGGLNNGVTIHAAAITSRYREVNKLATVHDGMHRGPITVARPSLDGRWLVTGCVDSTLRVWRYDGASLSLRATFCGHDGAQIRCIDVSTEFGVVASGCSNGRVILWDIRTLTYVRSLHHEIESPGAVSVSVNNKNGNVVTLVGDCLSVFDVNGKCLGRSVAFDSNHATSAIATNCPEWQEQGVVAVSGHLSGEVRFWSLDYEGNELVMRGILDANPHTSEITVLRATGVDRQDTLLVGDSSGKMSVCKTVQLDSYSSDELSTVAAELVAVRDAKSN